MAFSTTIDGSDHSKIPTTTATLIAESSSRLPHIVSQYRRDLNRIDALESRIEACASQKRRRAVSLLVKTPIHRNSHLRLFVTHRCVPIVHPAAAAATCPSIASSSDVAPTTNGTETTTNTSKQRWTLLIEGRLLIGYLDHESVATVESDVAAREAIRAPSLGSSAADSTAQNTALGKRSFDAMDSSSGTPRSTDMNAYRSVTEREGEEPVERILFTHFFDRMSVSFQSFQKHIHEDKSNRIETTFPTSDGETIPKREMKRNRTPKKEGGMVDENRASGPDETEYEASEVTTVLWERQPTKGSGLLETADAYAFCVNYQTDEPQLNESGNNDNSTTVVASILLHRRDRGETKYLLSRNLCATLFPMLLAEMPENTTSLSQSTDEATTSLLSSSKAFETQSGWLSPQFSSKRNATKGSSDAASQGELLDDGVPRPRELVTPIRKKREGTDPRAVDSVRHLSPAADNEIVIPTTLTMNEAINAIFRYIKDRNLQDKTDLSIIHNDVRLEKLFGCHRMLFSAVKGLLISRGLLKRVVIGTKDDAPIKITYVMTGLNAMPEPMSCVNSTDTRTLSKDSKEVTLDVLAQDTTTTTEFSSPKTSSKRRRIALEPGMLPKAAHVALSNKGGKEEEILPNILSCDVDIEVPGLYHDRTRELLRRVKRREFEYTSSRSKALKLLLSTKAADEDVIKAKMEEIIAGKRTLSKEHVPVLLALAKAAPAGSEARNVAHVDARIAVLLDRVKHHCMKAKSYWEVVDACRSISNLDD